VVTPALLAWVAAVQAVEGTPGAAATRVVAMSGAGIPEEGDTLAAGAIQVEVAATADLWLPACENPSHSSCSLGCRPVKNSGKTLR
jgi:hypothetical protein